MRTERRGTTVAFTLVELLVFVALMVMLAALIVPSGRGRSKPTTVYCLNNDHQVGAAFVFFAADNNSRFPQQISFTNGGSLAWGNEQHGSSRFPKSADIAVNA